MSDRMITTIKVYRDAYEQFKILGIKRRLTLQKLVERSMHLYVEDATFRSTIDDCIAPILSTTGSFQLASGSFQIVKNYPVTTSIAL